MFFPYLLTTISINDDENLTNEIPAFFVGNTLEVTNALQVLDVQSSSLVNNFMPPIWFEHLKNLRSLRLEGVPFSRYHNEL